MIHEEIFDLDDVMRGHADHLAGLGYLLTLAVQLAANLAASWNHRLALPSRR
jgi:hypothetical protein